MDKFKRALWKYRLKFWCWEVRDRVEERCLRPFWGWLLDHHPRLYDWCEKHLPFNTLPF